MKEKIDREVVFIPSLSDVRVQRYRDRICDITNLISSLDPEDNAYVISVLNRESRRLIRLLNEEGYDV